MKRPGRLSLSRAFGADFAASTGGELVELDTYSILMTPPNELVRPIHPQRMSLILRPEDHATWLEGSPAAAAGLLAPFPAAALRIVRSGEGETADPTGGPGPETGT